MRSAVLVLAAVVVVAATVSRTADIDEHPMDYMWELEEKEQVDRALDILRCGTDPERRWIASRSMPLFMELDRDADDAWARDRIVKLREWIAGERDEFVLAEVLGGLVEFEEGLVGPLFLELLRDESPNLRRRAAQYYEWWGEDPAAIPVLEDMWLTETRDWIRDDVVRALANLGSSRFVEDFVRLARGDDPVRATLALDALSMTGGSEAVRALISMATDPSFGRRPDVMSVLPWADSDEALETLLAASRDSGDAIRVAAASELARLEDPRAEERLLELAGGDPSPDVRYRALLALDEEDPRVRRVLEREAAVPATPESEALRRFAERQLAPPPEPDPRFRELIERQARGEEVDWESEGYKVETTTFSCSCGGSVLDPDDPEVLSVDPDDGRRTTRCWDAPGVAGDFETRDRILGGTLARISDYHDHHGELWVETSESCWVLQERLSSPSDEDNAPEMDPGPVHIEFDMFANEWRRGALDRLEGIARIEIFDRFESVTGVALETVLDEASIQALLDAYEGADEVADSAIRDVLEQVPAGLPLGTELRARLDDTLRPEPAETSAGEQ